EFLNFVEWLVEKMDERWLWGSHPMETQEGGGKGKAPSQAAGPQQGGKGKEAAKGDQGKGGGGKGEGGKGEGGKGEGGKGKDCKGVEEEGPGGKGEGGKGVEEEGKGGKGEVKGRMDGLISAAEEWRRLQGQGWAAYGAGQLSGSGVWWTRDDDWSAWSQQEQEGWDSSAWDGPEPWEKLV
ncbi:Uncharacterized protein SCF082_LOCUS44024, partial [Durusdinium trenchii]